MASTRRPVFACFAFVLFAVAGLCVPISDAAPPSDPRTDRGLRVSRNEHGPNELLVKLHQRKPVRHAEAAIRGEGANEVISFKRPRKLTSSPIDHWRLVKFSPRVDIEKVRARLLKNPHIDRVEYNFKVSIGLTPNDPMYPQLWGLNNIGQTGGTIDADIDAPEAWGVQTGSQDVVVAVIDTGVDYNHPDLSANIWTNPGEIPGNGIDDDGNGFIDDVHGYDFANNDGDPLDDHGHGTHVAGTIAAAGNNGIGVVGVAWQARIMAVKFLDAGGSGFTDGAINAVLYAASMGAKVMNNSWGGGGFSQALNDAIATADMAGALFVAAAGNSNSNNDVIPNYPSNYDVPNVLAVAATDHNDAKAGFSSYGATTVDLGAPGVDILSSVPTFGSTCCSDPSGYRLLSGTSMATPHVSGAAALVFAQFPGITHHQVKDRLMSSAEPVPSMQGITVTGGRLNIAAAFENDAIPPAAVTDLAAVNTSAFSVALHWGATGDDGMTGSATSYDLRYSTTPIDETNFNAATGVGPIPVTGPAGTIESYTVQDLDPATRYFFALKVRDNVGNLSPISNVVDAITKSVTVIFSDNFESGAAGWTIAGSNGAGGPALWHLSTHRSASPTTAFYYGQATTLNYETGARNFGSITSAPINLAGAKDSMLTFNYFLATENLSPFDTARVQVSADGGASWTDLFVTAASSNGMVKKSIGLATYDGQVIRLRFSFDTVDSILNGFEGWVVDDVVIAATDLQNDTTPPAPVADLTAQAVSAGSVTLGWTAPGDDGTIGSATAYDLRYSTAPIDDGNFAGATPVANLLKPSPAGTAQTLEVSGLAPGTQYYFALKSIDDVGNASGLSNVASAATAQIVVAFDDNFESGAASWTVTGSDGSGGPALWHLSTHRSASPITAFYYGKESTLDYATPARNFGSITSSPISLQTVMNSRLTFNHFLATENATGFDVARVQVSPDNGLTWNDIFVSGAGGGTGGAMVKQEFDLSAYDGKLIRLRFFFDTVDSLFNNFEGWVVDDVRIQGEPVPPAPPTAHAGGPYTGALGQAVQFNGSGSFDPNGDSLTYAWDFGDGTTGTGVAPIHVYAVRGTYTVTLIVNDGTFNSATATTTVSIVNQPPIAKPGGPYTAQRNIAVMLDGSGSNDPDGDPLTYVWDFGDGTGGTGPTPAHVYAATGTYSVKLTVNDGQVNSAVATTTVTVANTPPVANPGGPYSGQKNKAIVFDGTKSSDPNNDPLTYSWNFGDGSPAGTGPTPSHAYTRGGTYTVSLIVNDGTVDSAAVTTTVTVTNTPPVASLTGPFTINKQQSVTFNGSASSDADGDALTFNWTFGDGGVALNGGPNPTHAYFVVGTFTVTLTVNDGETDSAPATTTVTVLNRPPVANAGADQTVRQRSAVSLNGSASSDPDGSITQVAWRQVSGTAVTLSGANTVAPQFEAPLVRGSTPLQLVFELRVTDDDGATATDQVVITVDK
jgi:subtilisin family serine protease/PKD repeat protein